MRSVGRRGFLAGLTGFLAAPAIVRVASLMPVSVLPEPVSVFARYSGYDVLNISTADVYSIRPEEFQRMVAWSITRLRPVTSPPRAEILHYA